MQLNKVSTAFSLLKGEIAVHVYKDNFMLLAVIMYSKIKQLVAEAIPLAGETLRSVYY